MRNIFILPDGTEQDFMYPSDREIVVGEKFRAQMVDNSEHYFTVIDIQPEEKRILYKLSY